MTDSITNENLVRLERLAADLTRDAKRKEAPSNTTVDLAGEWMTKLVAEVRRLQGQTCGGCRVLDEASRVIAEVAELEANQ